MNSAQTKTLVGDRHASCPEGRRSGRVLTWLTGAVAGLILHPVHAVLFYSTADPNYNTSATGTIAETAWGYQGLWGSFMGTAISPRHFITAKHVGGSVGNTFTFHSVGYTTVASYDAPAGVDLRIWEVSGTLPTWAPLYTSTDELGKSLIVIGRGTQRGAEVLVSGASPTDLRGWLQGTADHVVRWGENVVSDTPTINGADYLAAEFNRGAGPNEAHLTVGDSGGAVFIQDPVDSLWKLAGINWAVDGLWSKSGGSDTGFRAAIFDAGGLYVGSQNNWTYNPDLPVDIPSHFYATRISSYQNWILTVIPEPAHYGWAAGGAALLALGFRRRTGRPRPR
ncbi:MAG: hypothetical protein D6766_04355 [Verrucomicrobia bacterium]|nr:MAG: hypothetical protein D6766_04355 [Verrucomicrobiota bacterium]